MNKWIRIGCMLMEPVQICEQILAQFNVPAVGDSYIQENFAVTKKEHYERENREDR